MGDLTKLTSLDLSSNNLTGTIPTELGDLTELTSLDLSSNNLAGNIPTDLGDLTVLTSLDLSSNNLASDIPIELGDLIELRNLLLHNNSLTGTVPTDLGDLTMLRTLRLDGNKLTDAIPDELTRIPTLTAFRIDSQTVEPGDMALCVPQANVFTNWLAGITSLVANPGHAPRCERTLREDWEALIAFYNATDGANWTTTTEWVAGVAADQAPTAAKLDDWHGVTVTNGRVAELDLGNNNLTGNIPTELGNLTALTSLDLDDNNLTGNIPTELGNLTDLTSLDLNDNSLTGSLPAALGNLTDLTSLQLHSNKLTGRLPKKLTDLTALEILTTNMQTVDAGQIVLCVPQTTAFDTWLAGIIDDFGAPTAIVDRCAGSLQEDWEALKALYNATNGTGWMTNTGWITGVAATQVPTATQLSSWHGVTVSSGRVTKVELNTNNLSGDLPTELGNLTELTTLALNDNSLRGTIPTELGDLTVLTTLSLRNNLLTGAIPTELGDLTKLTSLSLRSNNLEGTVPAALGNLTKLTNLWLHSNKLTGNLPEKLTDLTALTVLEIDRQTVDAGQIVLCVPQTTAFDTWLAGIIDDFGAPTAIVDRCGGSLQEDWEALKALYTATDGANWMTNTGWVAGVAATRVPTATELGGWHGVTVTNGRVTEVDLDDNNLSGSLPAALGNLAELTTLSLSSNLLTGTVPGELGKLRKLQTLRVNGNKLTDKLPEGLTYINTLTAFQINSQTVNPEQISLCVPRGAVFTTWRAGITSLAANPEHAPLCIGSLQDDWEALKALYNATDGANWTTRTKWGKGTKAAQAPTATELDSWHGVTVANGRVTQLRLGSNNLTGTIPPELGNLTKLAFLWLDSNNLTGTVPAALGNLTELTGLYLQSNNLTGELPENLTNLTLRALVINNQSVEPGQTALCVPQTTAFDTWLTGITSDTVDRCPSTTPTPPQPAPPGVRSIAFDSVPQQADTYGAGELVRVVVQFDRLISSIDRMQLLLDIGDTRVAAVPVPTTGPTDRLRFQYDVAAGDRDMDGISIAADALRLNIAADVSRQGDLLLADLGELEILNDPDHKVDAAERAVLKAALAAQGRAHLDSATDVIEQRFGAGRADDTNWAQLTQSLGSMVKDEQLRDAPWQSRLSHLLGNDFALALDGDSDQDGQTPVRGLTLWGALDNRNFAGDLDQGDFDGSMQTWYFGLDGTLGEQARWLAGVTVGTSSADTDYNFSGINTSGSGKLHTDLTSFYPYLHGRIGTGLEIWGLFGLGDGEAELTSNTRDLEKADLSLQLGSLGLKQRVLSQQRLKLSIRASIGYAQLETEAPSGLLQSLSAEVDRTQVGLEGEHLLGTWQPFWQVDSRRDGGDGLTGNGLELGGGVRFETGRLKGSIEAHYLATHSASSLEESSLSATLQLKPRSSGQGLSASLTPSWGDANSGIQHAWQQSALTLVPTPSDQSAPWSLQSRLGYGLAVPHSPAVLTPFMELNQDDHNTRQRLGLSLQFGSSSTLAIEMGVRRDQTLLQPPDTAAELKLQLQY